MKKSGLSNQQQNDFFKKIKGNTAHFIPLLFSMIGPEATATIIQRLALKLLSSIIGKEAAKEIIKALIKKFPWWAEWMGPIGWAISIGWFTLDLQGPAFRKTVEILLYLGVVGLRDGPEDGDAFWDDPLET